MSLKSKYSPPFTVRVLDDTPDAATLTFKRMLLWEWEELCETAKADFVDKQNAAINKELVGKVPTHECAEARARVRLFAEQNITMGTVIQESASTAKGIRRLLDYALVDKDQAEYLDVLSPLDVNGIVDAIVYLPVVKPSDPPKLPPQNEASGGGSEPSTSSLSGSDTPLT